MRCDRSDGAGQVVVVGRMISINALALSSKGLNSFGNSTLTRRSAKISTGIRSRYVLSWASWGCLPMSQAFTPRFHRAFVVAISTAKNWWPAVDSIRQSLYLKPFSSWVMDMLYRGDGEVSGVAIECPMERVDLTFHLRNDMHLTTPRAHTPSGWITLGFHENLHEASLLALEAMLDLMGEQYHLPRPQALALASLVMDLHVTQIANGVLGVHAVLPHEAIR